MKTYSMDRVVLALVFALFGSFGVSVAATGQAVIPHLDWGYQDSNNRSYTQVYVSNVTGATVTVTLILINNSGTLITDGDASSSTGPLAMNGSFSNYQESPSGGSVKFDVGAGQTASVRLYDNISTSFATGYGQIEWTQSGTSTSALVAHGKYFYKGSGTWTAASIPINNGRPF